VGATLRPFPRWSPPPREARLPAPIGTITYADPKLRKHAAGRRRPAQTGGRYASTPARTRQPPHGGARSPLKASRLHTGPASEDGSRSVLFHVERRSKRLRDRPRLRISGSSRDEGSSSFIQNSRADEITFLTSTKSHTGL